MGSDRTRYTKTIWSRHHKGRLIDVTTNPECVAFWRLMGWEVREMSDDELARKLIEFEAVNHGKA